MAELLNPIIKAYRKGETVPLALSKKRIVEMLNSINSGLNFGMPDIGAKTFGDKVLLEGREDAGTNGFNENNLKANALSEAVFNDTGNRGGVGHLYAAAVLDKAETAKRLGISFEEAWNGTGKSLETKRTGAQHSARAIQMQGAINDPKNKEFKDLIDRGISGNLTSPEQALTVPWGVLQGVFSGATMISENGIFTKEAKNGVKASIESRIVEAKLSPERADEVRKDLADSSDVLNILPILWQEAAGLKTKSIPEMSKMSPDTIGILNAIIGVQPIKSK